MRNKKEVFFITITILFCTVMVISCTNNKGPQAVTPKVSFSKDIIPIMTANCAINGGCHSGASNTGDNIDLDSSAAYSSIVSKDLISFNNLSASLLYVEISTGLMPKAPYSLLPTAQSNLILDWIKQGAKNN